MIEAARRVVAHWQRRAVRSVEYAEEGWRIRLALIRAVENLHTDDDEQKCEPDGSWHELNDLESGT